MNIDDLTIKQVKELQNLSLSLINQDQDQDSIYKIGVKYFIRTATYHCVGEIINKSKNELELKDAAWIADSGRLNNALKTGIFEEIEPFPNNLIVNINGIIDATECDFPLPLDLK